MQKQAWYIFRNLHWVQISSSFSTDEYACDRYVTKFCELSFNLYADFLSKPFV